MNSWREPGDATIDEGKGIPGNEHAVEMDCLNGNHPRPHSNHSPKKVGKRQKRHKSRVTWCNRSNPSGIDKNLSMSR